MDNEQKQSLALGVVSGTLAALVFVLLGLGVTGNLHFGKVAGAAYEEPSFGATYTPNRLPHGYWDTGGGYYVNGVNVIDNVGTVTALTHLVATGTVPTVSVAGTGYVAGGFLTGSTDVTGSVTSTVSNNAGAVIVTFASAFATPPFCEIYAANLVAATSSPYITSTVSQFSVVFPAGYASSTYQYNYSCIQ